MFLPQNGEDEDEALERKWLKIPPLKKGPLNEPHRPPFIGKKGRGSPHLVFNIKEIGLL